jgi:hypothetical protein
VNGGAPDAGSFDAGYANGVPAIDSPFFRDEDGSQAAKRLRGLFNRDDQAFANALTLVRKRDEKVRTDLCVGAALLAPGGTPTLGGWNLERVVPIDSLAKVAVLYAYYQLHADVAALGAAIDVAAAPDTTLKVQRFQDLIAAGFAAAKDPALQRIGKAPTQMPRLSRLFDLRPFVELDPAHRRQETLPLNTRSELHQEQSLPDDVKDKTWQPDVWTAATRLETMMKVSNNESATSLVADIGLPYIAALLERSGFAQLAENGAKGGLWLAAPYASAWPSRAAGDPPPITDAPSPVKATGGPSKTAKDVVQAGSVLGLTTLLLLLQRRELVNRWASEQMLDTMMGSTAMLTSTKEIKKHVTFEKSKVGISNGYFRFAEAALITSTPPSPAPRPGRPGEVTWCAVVLDLPVGMKGSAADRHAEATRVFGKLGAELEIEVAGLAR